MSIRNTLNLQQICTKMEYKPCEVLLADGDLASISPFYSKLIGTIERIKHYQLMVASNIPKRKIKYQGRRRTPSPKDPNKINKNRPV